MTLFNSAVTDPVALGELSAACDRPSNKQNVKVISIERHTSEAQDSSSGSELRTVAARQEAACGKKAKKKHRPCKGKRLRYRRFKERLEDAVMTAPHLMDAQSVAWPPSLQTNFEKQQRLIMRLTMCKLQQLKIQGEPCMIEPALNLSSPSVMSL